MSAFRAEDADLTIPAPSRAELLETLAACATPGLHPPHSEPWQAAVRAQQLVYRELGLDWKTYGYVDLDKVDFAQLARG